MPREYQAFPISNFRTGFDESVEPWLLPRDAYQTVINAHLYRGVLEKIEGYNLYANFTNRISVAANEAIDGVRKTFTFTLASTPVTSNFFGYGTIVAGSTAETFTYLSDASSTLINLQGTAGGTGTVDLNTNIATLIFNTAPPNTTYSNVFFTYDKAPSVLTAIMGIKQYYAVNGNQDILVFDQKRMGKIVNNFGVIASNVKAIQAVSEIPHDYYQSAVFTQGAATVTFISGVTATALTTFIVPGTVKFTEFASTGLETGRVVIDNGVGALTGTNVTSGSINYVTGAYTITFTVAPAMGNYFDATSGVYGDIFTGSISNFFSLTNYQFKAFFTNSVDRIRYYDGTSIRYLDTSLVVQPITSSAGVPTNTGNFITKCLHVFTNRERLLLIYPTVATTPAPSSIYWSVAGDPLDFITADGASNLQAPTSQPIRAIGFINSDLVVRFANSERVFRYTGDLNGPFRWDSTNNVWACDAPYSTINYDTVFTSVGKPAIVKSDGVNVSRADEIIPDFTDPTRLSQQIPVPFMSQTSIQQCYGERFDDIKEGWLCYNSQPTAENTVTASDNVLAFNYLDGTYAIYQFPFSCLGFGRIINVPTWATTYIKWEAMSDTWDSYSLTKDGLLDLAGDQFDKVYTLNSGTTLGDGTTPVLLSVITKNFNPFIEDGQLARLGYVDLFVSASSETKLRIQFYVNDQLYIDSSGEPAGYYQENTLTFTPTDSMSPSTDQIKIWKRIYVGAVGKEHTIRFYQHADDFTSETLGQPVFIHAMVLYMKPAGRIFN